MLNSSSAFRRWLGVFCLAVAAGMLIWGQTVLEGRLRGVGFLAYWLVCFLFTIGAIAIALLDIRALRRETYDEQRDLIQRTLGHLPVDSKGRTSASNEPEERG